MRVRTRNHPIFVAMISKFRVKSMKQFLFLVPIIALTFSGCETAEGFGRDLRRIENKASTHKPAEQPSATKRNE